MDPDIRPEVWEIYIFLTWIYKGVNNPLNQTVKLYLEVFDLKICFHCKNEVKNLENNIWECKSKVAKDFRDAKDKEDGKVV